MQITLRFADGLPDRAAGARLRHDIEEILERRFEDPLRLGDDKMDGRTLLAFLGDRVLGSVDVHWGGDEVLPADRVVALGLEAPISDVNPAEVVILDAVLVHPDFEDRNVAVELLQGAGRFAVSKDARFVFSEIDATGSGPFRSLGFRAVGPPRSSDLGPVVTVGLDLDDDAHLDRVGSPFAGTTARKRSLPRAALHSADEPPPEPRWRTVVRQLSALRNRNATFLERLDEEHLRRVVINSQVAKPSAGRPILQRGSKGRDLYVLLTGAVEVRRDGKTIAVLGPGEVFGEIGFLLDVERTADVIAASDDVSVLRVTDTALRTLIEADPKLGAELSLGLARAVCLKLVEDLPGT